MSISTHFKGAESVIRDILENNPITRNSDMELLFAVWKESGVDLTTFQKDMIKKSFSPETIRRTRQKIQENGEYLPTESATKSRRELQKEHRSFHKNVTKVNIDFPSIPRESDFKVVGSKEMEINGKKYQFKTFA